MDSALTIVCFSLAGSVLALCPLSRVRKSFPRWRTWSLLANCLINISLFLIQLLRQLDVIGFAKHGMSVLVVISCGLNCLQMNGVALQSQYFFKRR